MRSRTKARRNNRAFSPNTFLDVTPDAATPDAATPDALKKSVVKREMHCGECADCLWQAEICCEQARAAARLKRLHAACGLFATAQSLLTRAIASSGDLCVEACDDAREKLKNITSEMATYADLAKSAARPMRALHATSFTAGATPTNERTAPSQSRAHQDGLAS